MHLQLDQVLGEVLVGNQDKKTQEFPQLRLMVVNIVEPSLMPVVEESTDWLAN